MHHNCGHAQHELYITMYCLQCIMQDRDNICTLHNLQETKFEMEHVMP
jgi:hypothetical protein